jgi:zinc transport system substrate-binding protein
MKIFFLFLSAICIAFGESKATITTTLAPYAYAIKKIAGDSYQIHILIPEDVNPHIHETKPQDMQKLASSKLWFCSGEKIEKKSPPSLAVKKIDLNQSITLIHNHHEHDHHHSSCCQHEQDLHTWMSPSNYLEQSKTILNALTETFPHDKELFERGFAELEKELLELSQAIRSKQPESQNQKFVVAHAAYAYLCRDLGMTQVTLEYEGKEASLKHIQKIYQELKQDHPLHIFAEMQHSDQSALRLATLLKSDVIVVNPYQSNYPQAIKEILQKLP